MPRASLLRYSASNVSRLIPASRTCGSKRVLPGLIPHLLPRRDSCFYAMNNFKTAMECKAISDGSAWLKLHLSVSLLFPWEAWDAKPRI